MTDKTEGMYANTDGTIDVVLPSGAVHRLRRPTVAEYSRWVDDADEADWELRPMALELRDIRKRAVEGTASDDDRARAREINDFVRTAHGAIVSDMVETLSDWDRTDPLPIGMVHNAATALVNIMAHFESVPFHGSGRSGS